MTWASWAAVRPRTASEARAALSGAPPTNSSASMRRGSGGGSSACGLRIADCGSPTTELTALLCPSIVPPTWPTPYSLLLTIGPAPGKPGRHLTGRESDLFLDAEH